MEKQVDELKNNNKTTGELAGDQQQLEENWSTQAGEGDQQFEVALDKLLQLQDHEVAEQLRDIVISSEKRK